MKLLRQQGHTGPLSDRNQYMQALKQVREQRRMRAQEPKPFVPKIPEWAKADDVIASVVNELVSLADDLDTLGATREAIAVDHQLKAYAKATGKLYDVTGETGEQLIGQAHPGGGPTLVPAAEEGGKVETIVEEQKKNMQKALKQPTGKYAETMMKLIATANRLEEEGEIEAAKIVDKTIAELRESDPFVNRSAASEAVGSDDANASIKTAMGFDQTRSLRVVLGGLVKILDNLESNVQDQGFNEINKNLNINLFESINDKDKWPQAETEYSLRDPAFPGPKSYLYDEYVTARRKEVESWLRQMHGWPKKENHAKWMLQHLKKWLKNFAIIQKYYKDFPDDDVDGSWDPGFNAKFRGAIEKLAGVANQYGKAHEPMQRERPKTTKSPKPDTKPGPQKTKSPGGYQEQYKSMLQKRMKARADAYVRVLDDLAKFVMSNDTALNKKLNPGAVQKLLEWATKQKYNVQSKPDYAYHIKLTDKSVKNLAGYLAKLKGVVHSASVKTADDVPGVALPGAKPTAKKPVTRRRKPAVKSDPVVRALQQAIMAAGIPLPRFKDDGKWGKETAGGWLKLVAKLPKSANLPTNRVPNKAEMQRATRFARVLAKNVQKDSTKFKLYLDKVFTLGDFDNVRNFLAALDRNYQLNREEVADDPTYMRAVIAHIRKLYASLQGDEGKFISNYYGPQTLNLIQSKFLKVVRQIGQYGLPSKKKETDVPGLAKTPGEKSDKLEAPPSRGNWKPGAKDVGVKGLNFPITKANEITLAIRMLPDQNWLTSTRNFTMKARAAVREKGSPLRKLAPTQKGVAQQYWKLLDARVRDIITALGTFKQELLTRDVNVYKQMVRVITSFNNELTWVGQQLGFVQ